MSTLTRTTAPIRPRPALYRWQDPRTIDGETQTITRHAVAQLSGLLKFARRATEETGVMVRNTVMDEGLEQGDRRDPAQWYEDSQESALVDLLLDSLAQAQSYLDALANRPRLR